MKIFPSINETNPLGDDGKTISMVDPGRRWVPILVQDVCGGSAPIPQVWSLSMGVYCLLEVQFQLLVIGPKG